MKTASQAFLFETIAINVGGVTKTQISEKSLSKFNRLVKKGASGLDDGAYASARIDQIGDNFIGYYDIAVAANETEETETTTKE